jgi:hypothetical protein
MEARRERAMGHAFPRHTPGRLAQRVKQGHQNRIGLLVVRYTVATATVCSLASLF